MLVVLLVYSVELKPGPASANTMTGRGVPGEFFHIGSLMYVRKVAQSPYCHFEHPNDRKEERRDRLAS